MAVSSREEYCAPKCVRFGLDRRRFDDTRKRHQNNTTPSGIKSFSPLPSHWGQTCGDWLEDVAEGFVPFGHPACTQEIYWAIV